MALDPGPIGRLTMALIERLEADYEQVEGVELRAAMVIVDLELPDPGGKPATWTAVRWHFAERSTGWDANRASSAYAAGVVAEAHAALTDGACDPYGDE